MIGLGVALLTFLVFSLASSGDFLAWDDRVNLLSHESWRGLGEENLRWMLTTRHQGPWQPLSWLSWALDHALWGLDAAAFRRTNVLLHSIAAGLFAECARLLIPRETRAAAWGAALAGLLFALHPLRVESVLWITERRDVLCGAFFAGALLAHLRGRRPLSLALFAAALLSKGTAVGLAWIVLLLEKDKRRALPYFALALAAGLMNLAGLASGDIPSVSLGLGERLVVALHALAFYAAKWLAPVALSPYYPLPASAWSLWPWAAAGVALTVAALRTPFRWHWAAYALMLAPVSGLLQNGAQAAADRYSYLATLPFALLAGSISARLPRRAAAGVALAAIPLLAALTLGHARHWRDDVSLWARAISLSPDAYLPRSNYALALHERGDKDAAAAQYEAALRLEPRDVESRVNLAVIRGEKGDRKAAESLYREALALRPAHAPAHFNLAFLLRAEGRRKEGLSHLREALRLEPALAARLPKG